VLNSETNYQNTYIKNLETGNVQHTNEVISLVLGFKSLVDSDDEPLEHTIVQRLGQGADGVGNLVLVTTLGHELVADLDLGLQETLLQVACVDAQEESYLLSLCNENSITN